MPKNEKTPPKKPTLNPYWFYGSIVLFFLGMSLFGGGNGLGEDQKINISTFERYLNDGEVSRVVVVNKNTAQVTLTEEALEETKHKNAKSSDILGRSNDSGPHYQFEVGNLELFQKKLEAAEANGVEFSYEFKTVENRWLDVLIGFLPLILIIAIWLFIMRRMSGGGGGGGGAQIFNIGKSKAKLFDEKTDVKVTFKDVAGLEGAKEEVQEIVDFLKNPTKYTVLGGKIPKGALLVGPPGTGKTLLAKAVAGEAKVPFFSLSGSDFVEMFVGVGASRVRDLFKQAKDKSPGGLSRKYRVPLGSVLTLEAKVSRAFGTSMEVFIDVWIEAQDGTSREKANEAIYTFVAVSKDGKPVKVPAVIPETELEQKRFDGALRRRQLSLILAGKLTPDKATELKALFQ